MLPCNMLPACLLDAWDKTVACHLTELDTADAELAHISFWTSGERTAVVHTARSLVLRKLVESSPVASFFESLSLSSVFSNQFRAFNFAGFH